MAVAAFDLDEAEAARAERLEHVGRAQAGYCGVGQCRRAHHGRALGHRYFAAIDCKRYERVRGARRSSVVAIGFPQHWLNLLADGPRAISSAGLTLCQSAG